MRSRVLATGFRESVVRLVAADGADMNNVGAVLGVVTFAEVEGDADDGVGDFGNEFVSPHAEYWVVLDCVGVGATAGAVAGPTTEEAKARVR